MSFYFKDQFPGKRERHRQVGLSRYDIASTPHQACPQNNKKQFAACLATSSRIFKLTCCLIALLLTLHTPAAAQLMRYNPGGDSTKTVSLEGYADIYYGYDFSKPRNGERAYFVSQNRHNEVNINLAYLSLRYNSKNLRAVFTPALGTYMNANYVNERSTLRHVLEATVGVRLAKNKAIWLDAGVFSSPYTTETPVSYDQMMYTRAFAPEYVPYYLSGAKLTLPVNSKLTTYFYLLNGWQQIEDVNRALSQGATIEYKPSNKLQLNLNLYTGNEQSVANPNFRRRNLLDFFALYTPTKKWSFIASAYRGSQARKDSAGNSSSGSWWQTNVSGRYSMSPTHSVAARAEYFKDPTGVMIVPVTGVPVFKCFSYSLGYNRRLSDEVLFRVEGRWFTSPNNIFLKQSATPAGNNLLLIAGLTAKF